VPHLDLQGLRVTHHRNRPIPNNTGQSGVEVEKRFIDKMRKKWLLKNLTDTVKNFIVNS
jgi:hypothetical protein